MPTKKPHQTSDKKLPKKSLPRLSSKATSTSPPTPSPSSSKARPRQDTASGDKRYQDDQLLLIKPYKGRQKFELYIHHAPLREFLIAGDGLRVPKEGFDGDTPLRKKLIFREATYGTMLQAICTWLEHHRKRRSKHAELQATICEISSAIVSEFKLNDPAKQEAADFGERLQRAYQRAASLFAELMD